MAASELYTSALYSDANLVGYWRFEGNSNDSKASYNGTDTSITYSTGNGKFGEGAGFNGSSSKISIANNSALTPSPMSWSFWLNPVALPTSGNGMMLIDKRDDTSGTGGYRLELHNSSGTQQIIYQTTNGSGYHLTANVTLSTNSWSHIAVTGQNGSVPKLYVNGTSQSLASSGTGSTADYAVPLLFGVDQTGASHFNGAMDDIALFSRVLTASEIQYLALSSFPQISYGSVYVSNASWSTAHSAASGTARNAPAYVQATTGYFLERSFLVFDTSTIGSGVTITGASIVLTAAAILNGATQLEAYNIYSSSGGDTVSGADFNKGGATAFSTAIAQTSLAASGSFTWTFNASGISAINNTTKSHFSVLEVTYDVLNTTPTDLSYWAFNNATLSVTVSSTIAYTRSMSDSILSAASRSATLSRIFNTSRSISDSIMNAASRFSSVGRGLMRNLSDSIMNAKSLFTILGGVLTPIQHFIFALSDSIMNGANRLTKLSVSFIVMAKKSSDVIMNYFNKNSPPTDYD